MSGWKNPDSVLRLKLFQDKLPHCTRCAYYRGRVGNGSACQVHTTIKSNITPRDLASGRYCCWDFKWNQDNQP